MKEQQNIILIGMSGAGKSTLGVLLAKALGMQFTDTDLLIQQHTGKLLQQILDTEGVDAFLQIEEKILLSCDFQNCVIATGGSAVYSQKGMEKLRQSGTVVYLAVDYEELKRRLLNITTRGIVFKGGADLHSLLEERLPLYEKYADLRVEPAEDGIEGSVEKLVLALQGFCAK